MSRHPRGGQPSLGPGWPRRIALAIILVASHAVPAFGSWRTYTTLDGLTSNAVSAVYVDHSGAVWIGTLRGGANRFDGVAWSSVQSPDQLGSNRVNAIAEDRDGNLWFDTDHGATRYDGRAWTQFEAIGGVPANPVTALLLDRSGRLWFGTGLGGVTCLDGTQWTTYTTLDGLLSNAVTALCEDHRDTLWVGFQMPGVSRYGGTTWSSIRESDLGLPIQGASIVEDRRGTLWFSGGTVLWAYDGSAWRSTMSSARGLPNFGSTGAVVADPDGGVWLSEVGRGVNHFDGALWRQYSNLNTLAKDALGSDEVTQIAVDLEGNLWFGTAANGITRFDGSSWRLVDLNNGSSACLDCGVVDHRGILWFALSASRVARFNGSAWTYYGGGIDNVRAAIEDQNGNVWFGGSQISVFNTSTFFATSTNPGGSVLALFQDRLGYVWAGLDGSGVSRYNGASWFTYTTANTAGALPGMHVTSVAEDSSGLLWFAADGGLATFDGLQWRRVRAADGSDERVDKLLLDRQGRLWNAGPMRVERYDGGTWTAFNRDEGVPTLRVESFVDDRDGHLWMGTSDHGAIRFDGEQWGYYSATDGLESDAVGGIVQDTTGTLWFEFPHRLSRFDPDRVSPKTLITLSPAPTWPSRSVTFEVAARGEDDGVRFSMSLDGAPWSPWQTSRLWSADGLFDGAHVLQVRSRDKIGNVDNSPATFEFEVDATPPDPRIDALPMVVRDSVAITGVAADARIREYRLELRQAGAPDWSPERVTLLGYGTRSVTGTLAWWPTRSFPDGPYDLRLSVVDTLGLAAAVTMTATVDNAFPDVDHTSPALVRVLTGGDVYTTDGLVRLYFPPHAFAEDATVVLAPVAPDSLPGDLPSGAVGIGMGIDLGWTSTLEKPVRLSLRLEGASVAGTPVLYRLDGSAWTRLGGTFDPDHHGFQIAVTIPGRHAVFAETSAATEPMALHDVSFTPRVFSPTGRFADREVGIGFVLGRPAPVTVRVFSRSGRLIREVVSGLFMNAGANLVQWDGRDRVGAVAIDGLYVVTVEALGHIERSTLAVVH